ncbi:MAG TPA: ribosome-associated translation inhibitor RaiA [Alphaproteobacteria bacterium]|nr:ribosome-associated translation inhibitor RaiA [Alphaproteobacteria bacterium]
MQLSVTGKQIDIGQALQEHVTDVLNDAVEKYFGSAMDGAVVFSREAQDIHAEISVHVGKGIQIQAHATAGDAYSAFDNAAEHMAKRLRRYKRRLRNHHRSARTDQAIPAQAFVLAGEGPDDSEPATDEPVVVAEMEAEIPSLTVGEAVMRLDLANTPAMMFRNSAHGGLNMLYRRPDGTIGWVDPRGNREQT